MKTKFLFVLIILAEMLLLSPAYAGLSASLERFHSERMIFSVTSGDIDGDGRTEIIAGAFDNRVYVIDQKGGILWFADVKGLPYAMDTADINGDGKEEIVVASLDPRGTVYALGYQKGVLWTYVADQPFLAVAIGDMDHDGAKEIAMGSFDGDLHILNHKGVLKEKKNPGKNGEGISAIAFGNLDKDPGDEMVVGTSKGIYVYDHDQRVLWKMKKKEILGEEFIKDEFIKTQWVRSVIVADMDNDGKSEVLIGGRPSGLITALNSSGKKLWQKNFSRLVNRWSNIQLGVGNLLGDGNKEILGLLEGIVLTGTRGTSPIMILDSNGNDLGEISHNAGFFSFTILENKEGDNVIMSSSVRGRGLYRGEIKESGAKSQAVYEDEVLPSVKQLIKSIESSTRTKVVQNSNHKIHMLYRTHYNNIYDQGEKHVWKLLNTKKSDSTDNIEVELILTSLYEKGAQIPGRAKHGEVLSTKRVLEVMESIEARKIPFYLNIGQHLELYFQIDTLEKILKGSTGYLKGFIVDEDRYTKGGWDVHVQNMERVLDILSKHEGTRLIMNEYRDSWHKAPLDIEVFKRWFKPQYKDILIPVYKVNRLSSPELNIGVILGLWKSHTITRWGIGLYQDIWKWESAFISPPGDVMLRLMVMAESLGATYFIIPPNILENEDGIWDFAGVYEDYIRLFDVLIQKEIISPTKDFREVIVSPVSLQEREDLKSHNKGEPKSWRDTFGGKEPLSTGFLLQAVRENYIPGYLYQLTNYYDGLFPRTPYGFVAIFPQTIDPLTVEGMKDFFIVEGDRIHKKDQKAVIPAQHKKAISDVFQQYSSELPFNASGVFLSTKKLNDGYKVYLINPGHFETKDVMTELRVNLKGTKFIITDAISDEVLPVKDNKVTLSVPSGLFRILQVSVITNKPTDKMERSRKTIKSTTQNRGT
ncbi:MAG: hypothetical protein A3D21_03170 [Nitrospirae bacterium RIFCSPHIGHO2_02_FULL_42_12]|nr:MAG: hypothetical protein A3D21_03170 [Nitrospirae bacterium RIFCSPHIGHO2_02_FULL_42_12]